MAVVHPWRIPRPPTMIGLSSGEARREVIAGWTATPEFSMPTSIGSVEQEQNGVTAPKSSPLMGPGTFPLLIQSRIFSGPNRRLISATAVETTRNRASSSPSSSAKVPSVSVSIGHHTACRDLGLGAAGSLSGGSQGGKVGQPLNWGGQLFAADRDEVRPALRGHFDQFRFEQGGDVVADQCLAEAGGLLQLLVRLGAIGEAQHDCQTVLVGQSREGGGQVGGAFFGREVRGHGRNLYR